MAKKKKKGKAAFSLEEGLKWPWANGKRQWNILWGLIPIYGWFAIIGYVANIIGVMVKGDMSGLPEFGSSWDNFLTGLKLFIFVLPLYVVVMAIGYIPSVGSVLNMLLSFLLLPYMIVHVVATETFKASFDFRTWWRVVFGNLWEYVIALFKTLVYSIAYLLLSIVLVGIPGLVFGGYIYYADFYRRFT